jgi:hypothetical protein
VAYRQAFNGRTSHGKVVATKQGYPMPQGHDLAKIYYSAARAEVLQRLAMREQVLLAGVTAFGVIGGLALANGRQHLLSLFPVLSLAFAVLHFRHHFLMAHLGQYIRSELDPSLGFPDVEEVGVQLPAHWDNWLRNEEGSSRIQYILLMELLGSWLLLWLPGLIGLLVLRSKISRPLISVDIVLLVGALIPFLLETKHLISNYYRRRRVYKGTNLS